MDCLRENRELNGSDTLHQLYLCVFQVHGDSERRVRKHLIRSPRHKNCRTEPQCSSWWTMRDYLTRPCKMNMFATKGARIGRNRDKDLCRVSGHSWVTLNTMSLNVHFSRPTAGIYPRVDQRLLRFQLQQLKLIQIWKRIFLEVQS